MWPYEHIQENVVSSTLNDAEEVDSLTSYPSTPSMSPQYMPAMTQRYIPAMAPRFITAITSDDDSETESEEEDLGDDTPDPPSNCKPVDLLLLKSLEPYAAVQRTTAVRQLRCECSEILTVRSEEELRTTRVLRPSLSQGLRPRRRNRALAFTQSSSGSASASTTQIYNLPSAEETESTETNTAMSTNMLGGKNSSPPPWRRFHLIQGLPQPSLLATQVANRVINYARYSRNTYEDDICCLNCGFYPICPVTSPCGHTRCTNCVEKASLCPCGIESPKPLYVNILIRELGKKADCAVSSCEMPVTAMPKIAAPPVNKLLNGEQGSTFGPIRTKRRIRPNVVAPISGAHQQLIPLSARARITYATELLQNGRYRDAAPQLALAATSSGADLHVARPLLAQVIMILSGNRDPRGLTRELNHQVRHFSSMSWIKTDDMECILCCEIFTNPVTTPCGHMFCRTCLEKTLDYRKRCPLCLRGLGDFNLAQTSDTLLVKGALAAINALKTPIPLDDDLVPLFVCTVAYPSISCPLYIFDPRYRSMIRRVLESGSRRFGMVVTDQANKLGDYGTLLEVRDCVQLEDGKYILSTRGLYRFKVMERRDRDGYEVARIEPIRDVPPKDRQATNSLKLFAAQIMCQAVLWLSTLDSDVLSDIENTFGSLLTIHKQDVNEEWWDSADGPLWLWWLIAVLPLRVEVKVLILSTDCLLKRMMAVVRTLNTLRQVTLTSMGPGQYQVRLRMPNINPN